MDSARAQIREWAARAQSRAAETQSLADEMARVTATARDSSGAITVTVNATGGPRLLDATTPGPDEATVREFCGRIVQHLEAARATTYASGWPPERFTVLPARDWP